ncbi:MAG: TetR/AcrR family transcriptional regulator [Solirubrobacteraceae bacterium]
MISEQSSSELPIAGRPPERSDAAANRDRILCAARRILAEHGAVGLSMNSVAAAAGVGKGTIFRRFGDRDGLLRALLDEHTIELQNAWLSGPPPLGPGAPPQQRLEAFIVGLLQLEDQNLELMLAADRYSHLAAPTAYATFRIHVAMLVEQIDPTLDSAVIAALVLNSIAPPVMGRLRHELGTGVADLEVAAIQLLRGLTGAR